MTKLRILHTQNFKQKFFRISINTKHYYIYIHTYIQQQTKKKVNAYKYVRACIETVHLLFEKEQKNKIKGIRIQ